MRKLAKSFWVRAYAGITTWLCLIFQVSYWYDPSKWRFLAHPLPGECFWNLSGNEITTYGLELLAKALSLQNASIDARAIDGEFGLVEIFVEVCLFLWMVWICFSFFRETCLMRRALFMKRYCMRCWGRGSSLKRVVYSKENIAPTTILGDATIYHGSLPIPD